MAYTFRNRCLNEARSALGEACHAMDIRFEDRAPDQAKWDTLERQLSDLLASAYVRNHVE